MIYYVKTLFWIKRNMIEGTKYIYIEINEWNIRYQNHNEYFKCKRCIFLSCPKCFNNYYCLEEETKCPMCRF